MGWNTVKQTTEQVEDLNPDLYVKRAESYLRQNDIETALFEIDKAIKYSDYNPHYTFEKIKILNHCGYYRDSIILIDSNFSEFKRAFGMKKISLVLLYLNSSYFNEKCDDTVLNQKTINYKNGDSYFGEKLGSNPHGQGVYFFNNGDKYVGEFEEAKKQGKGTYIWNGGRKYIGEWKDNKRHGNGILLNNDGSKYIGKWKNDEKYGTGRTIYPNGVVEEITWKEENFIYKIVSFYNLIPAVIVVIVVIVVFLIFKHYFD